MSDNFPITRTEEQEHWQIISGGGRIISNTAQQLWDGAIEYFRWVDDHPIRARRTLTTGKTQGQTVEVEYKRPYTIKAMCLHCGISERYLNDIKESHSKDSEYYTIVEKILMIIYNQNLEGAIVDLYNPIIVAKVLNMDKDSGERAMPIRVEVVEKNNLQLSNSENEVLKNLDFEKVEILKDKVENPINKHLTS